MSRKNPRHERFGRFEIDGSTSIEIGRGLAPQFMSELFAYMDSSPFSKASRFQSQVNQSFQLAPALRGEGKGEGPFNICYQRGLVSNEKSYLLNNPRSRIHASHCTDH